MTIQPPALIACLAFLLLNSAAVSTSSAQTAFIDASAPLPLVKESLKLGTSRNPAGHEITLNNVTLLRDGKPWLPVMGEFHYSRYPAREWRDELLKMKAGGITVVATYVFWIHHEEVKDQWDWSGDRSLRDFVKTCGEVGLPVIVRAGPWCHGEVRNGGIPDWALPLGRRLRTTDPEFLGLVKALYGQIAEQLKGLQWKEGGPVIGMQFDNEYGGRADYLLALKQIANDAGIDLPIYTRTGWPALSSPMPPGQIVPLYGAYAEGFWDRVLTSMPGKYWFAFVFSPIRSDVSIGTDLLGDRDIPRAEAEASEYPFLSCELGGGMMNSYHRRILIDPRDVESVALVKTGSGSNLPGYYMYHGGMNPQGRLTTLMEAQNTQLTNWNDMPVKNYDFQAPLGSYGQVREHYHGLRKLHLFLADWGGELAPMPAWFPAGEQKKNDTEKLRWSVRTDGNGGFVFINNYQRSLPMPAKKDVQFEVKLGSGTAKFPAEPVTIPADSYFFWPFNMNLNGGKLLYATAQPICRMEQNGTEYLFFGQTQDVPSEFVFDRASTRLEYTNGVLGGAGSLGVINLHPGLEPAIKVRNQEGKSTWIFLFDPKMSNQVWKGTVNGKDRIVVCDAPIVFDEQTVRATAFDGAATDAKFFDAGSFKPLEMPLPAKGPAVKPQLEQIRQAGPVRMIRNGAQRVAEEPSDADFDQAAVWRIKLPTDTDPARDLLLRIHYEGDVARLYLDGKLIADDFYNGREFDLGLKRFGADAYGKELLLKILPLQKDAPIFVAPQAIPKFGDIDSIVRVNSIEVVERTETSARVP
jgi:hypothetical protein